MKKVSPGYLGVVFSSLAIAVIISWSGPSEGFNGAAYDWVFAWYAKSEPSKAVVLAIDEETLNKFGGMRRVRTILANALDRLQVSKPKVIAVDLILADAGDKAEDIRLASVLKRTPNLVLSSDLLPSGDWEDPLPILRQAATAVGHVHARPDPVSRVLPLEVSSQRVRRWAVCLEAFRLFEGASSIIETPEAIDVASVHVPATRTDGRAMRVLYIPGGVQTVSIAKLLSRNGVEVPPGAAVFVGVTAQSAARDRLMTPFGDMMSGVEIHAHAFETLRRGRFVREASPLAQAGLAVLIAMAAGLIFFFLSGWPAYGLGLLLIALSQVIPHIAMHLGFVVPYATPMLVSWLTTASAATWMYFGTRRELRRTEADKARYRQAIHFVTHEMRSPLTAIQGSSELMGRYNLNEDKRKQMAQMINSESKRLARMIQTFLDIERLSDGSMDFRKERVSIIDLVNACVERAQPLAERKQIRVMNQVRDSLELSGDRELLEYAVYNLITNAIKYSPDETTVTLSTTTQDHVLRLHVADQGIGIEQKDLPQIFKKFYRTKKAETSGEVGTGIGLSIVEQIVQHHQGRIEVTSTPGKGSCFTMVLPRAQAPERTPASSTVSNS